MKKIVTVLLVLIMALSVFTACGNDKSALEKAGEYLYAMYKDDDKSVTPNDFEVVGVVSVDGVKYTVEWTTDNDKIKLVPNETTKMVKVDVDERSETEEKYTLTATIKDEKGKTYTVKFEHTVPQFVVSTVAQVKEMADGTDVVLSGVVVKIDTAWSDSYKNISVTLKDAAGNTILLYRLATKVELGDTLIVTGKVGSYNNAKQIAAGATAVIEVDHSAVGCTYPATGLTAVCTVCGKVNPAHTTCVDSNFDNKCDQCGKGLTVTVLTIPQVLASEDGTAVVVQGIVSKINYNWSDTNGNMSVTISDGDGNELYIFKLATKVELYDTITVTGTKVTFNGTKEIDAGATATIDAKHTTHTYPATGLTAICTVCGQVNPEHTSCTDSDSNGKCDACGAAVVSSNQTLLNYSVEEKAAAGSWADGAKPYSNNVFELDSNITMTLTATPYGSYSDTNTGKYYTSGNQIRIYQNESPEITISAATGYTIKSVKISYAIKNTGVLTQGTENIASGTDVTVNASSVTFGVGNTGTATNGQVRITAIEIVYEAVN